MEHLYRVAGELVYVCPKHPNGVGEAWYRRLLQNNREAAHYRAGRRSGAIRAFMPKAESGIRITPRSRCLIGIAWC